MPRVEPTEPFLRDVHRQVTLLVENEQWTRMRDLTDDLAVMRERLMRFPELGRELLADEGHTLRQVLLGQVPYLIWYRYHRRTDIIRFVRLFHPHQRTPKPRMWLRV